MPVFVHGNTQSKVFVVYLHGGPGASSLDAYQNPESPFTKLQNDNAVVYWDQRCAGSTQGSCGNLSLLQYTQDLEKLIFLINNKYGTGITYFLIGHSWGGTLGIKYLTEKENQAQIKGWIEVGGGHNVARIVQLEKKMLLEVGNEQIAKGLNSSEWQTAIEKANNLDFNKIDDIYEMNRIANNAERLMKKAGEVNETITNSWTKDYFFSPVDPSVENSNIQVTFEKMKNELATTNLSDSLQKINIPTLMLWGKYDFRVPPAFAQEEFKKYGSNEKELILLDRSAHFVQFNEADLFYERVKSFIEKYK
jgi:pimeloyl-ACP methyl ester carboxylesterase